MKESATIQYLTRAEIDIAKWNRCIEEASNGLIYAYAFYLDALCSHWDALVWEDYEAVMPLPWRKKWGFRYVYTPAFVQQLGVISPNDISGLIPLFQKQTEQTFQYGSYNYNFQNAVAGTVRNNYILDLHKAYDVIKCHYKKDLQKNLKRAGAHQLSYHATNDYTKAILQFQHHYQQRMAGVRKEDFHALHTLCAYLYKNNSLIIREVTDSKGSLLAILLCLLAKERIYLLLSTTTPEGRNRKANHFLLDQLIREFANKPLVLDFEGSDLPGVAHFYENFGGINQPYRLYQWNKLPWPARILKQHT